MTLSGILLILAFLGLVLALARPVGALLHHVFEDDAPPGAGVLGPVERLAYRGMGVDPKRPMGALAYARALLGFSATTFLLTFAVLFFQDKLPWNPRDLPGLSWHLALNTAVSFTTNTNWQSYGGESTLSNLSQAFALVPHNFLSAAVGMAVAVAMARGLCSPRRDGLIGNFWQDLVRGCLYVLLPLSLVYALVLVSLGVPQTLASVLELPTLEGARQTLALGPVASQIAIKMLGTNGGGFYNVNAAHPFENPTALSNFIQMLSIFLLPAGLVHSYGRMSGNPKNGYAILGAMSALFLVAALCTYAAEATGSGLVGGASGGGSWEGKEVRFGIDATALFATITTSASCGAVNGMHDSFTALGGMVPLVLIQLGEVVFGGVGAGLYGMLVMVILTVFLAGLLVGRTPELLGKKVEAAEVKLATLVILVTPVFILVPSALAAVSEWGTGALANPGPHGWTEILYAFSSANGNNGSAFAGLSANVPWWNSLLAISMVAGRFFVIVPCLFIAGSFAGKRLVPPSPGTFPTTGPLFTLLLIGVIVIVGALTFFPALALGPIAEATAG